MEEEALGTLESQASQVRGRALVLDSLR